MRRIYLLAAATVIFAVIALSVGSVAIDNVWQLISNPDFSSPATSEQIIWQIRAPRIIGAILVGLCLGIAGVLAQGATNNPLADPSFLGTTAGAALGVVIGVQTNAVTISSLGAVAFAACGALLATLLTFSLARSVLQVIIVGISISALLSAIVGVTIAVAGRSDLRSLTFWSLGSLSLITWSSIPLLFLLAIGALGGGCYIADNLDLLSLGDPSARHLGRNPQRIRLIAFIILSIIIAVCVSQVGTISLLALAAPHIARFILGPRHRNLMMGSAVIGSVILLIADTLARSVVPPQDLPIGLLISFIGAPVLIVALKRSGLTWR